MTLLLKVAGELKYADATVGEITSLGLSVRLIGVKSAHSYTNAGRMLKQCIAMSSDCRKRCVVRVSVSTTTALAIVAEQGVTRY